MSDACHMTSMPHALASGLAWSSLTLWGLSCILLCGGNSIDLRYTPDLLAPVWSCAVPSPLFCRPMGSPRRDLSLDFALDSIANTLLSGLRVHAAHAAHGSLIIGGAISGNYRRPRCSRRPPPVARGVARVLCLGQTGHRDNPTESSEDARTTSSPDQNRLLPGCEPRLSLTPSTPTSRT